MGDSLVGSSSTTSLRREFSFSVPKIWVEKNWGPLASDSFGSVAAGKIQISPPPKKYFTLSDPHRANYCHIYSYIAYIFWHSTISYLPFYSDILFWHSVWHLFWHSLSLSGMGTARPQPRAPDLSGHCWTSTASSRSQWALPDLSRGWGPAVPTEIWSSWLEGREKKMPKSWKPGKRWGKHRQKTLFHFGVAKGMFWVCANTWHWMGTSRFFHGCLIL